MNAAVTRRILAGVLGAWILLTVGAGIAAAPTAVVPAYWSGYIERTYMPIQLPPYEYYFYQNTSPVWGSSHPNVQEERGYISFYTQGVIPTDAVISKVEYYYNAGTCISSGPGAPSTWVLDILVSTDFVDQISEAQWHTPGTLAVRHQWDSSPQSGWFDLGDVGIAMVYDTLESGDSPCTCVALRDFSCAAVPGEWRALVRRCTLRVTYRDPNGGDDAGSLAKMAVQEEATPWSQVKSLYR